MNNGITVINLLRRASQLFPDRKVYGNMQLTYSELYSNVRKISDSLNKMGIGNGTVIAVADFNSIEFLELLFASSMAGAVIYPVNIKLPGAMGISTIRESGASYLFASDPFLQAGIGKDFGRDHIISMSGNNEYTPFSNLLKGNMHSEDVYKSGNEYSILFTSGTTGKPKEIMYTNTDTVNGAMSILYQLGLFDSPASLNHEDNIMSLIPFYHIWSWGSPFHAAYLGSNYVLSGRYDAENILKLIEKYSVTWINAVPTMVYDILAHDKNNTLNNLKMLIGGSSINRGLTEKLIGKNIKFSIIYGGTDMLATAISMPSGKNIDYDYIRTTVHPVPLANVSIRDSSGNDVGIGKMGEIFVNSPWLPGKYLNREKSPEYEHGWFRTGDMGIKDKYGGIKILDRISDVIKSGGEWIPTSILESIISEVPGVLNNAVIGIPDEKWGEKPVAYIQGSGKDMEISIKKILGGSADSGIINKWWIPVRFSFINEMPLTSVGKNDKKKLREMEVNNRH